MRCKAISIIMFLFVSTNIIYSQSWEQQKVMDLNYKDLDKYVTIVLQETLQYHCQPQKVKIKGLDVDGTLHIAILCSGGKDFAIYIYGDYEGTIQATTCQLYEVIERRLCWK